MHQNQELIDYLNNLAKGISNLSREKLGEGFQKQKTRLSRTNKEARTNARIDASLRGESIDESETPIEELETVGEDVIIQMLKRKINGIFRG
ncbi:hypothetical protein LCGC14_2858120 [marine sediment metagenome]|uniref:Uncharacterized protein n=1 Tax=marine sediment metagenome TaxID=412755 RepID=A0A0F9AEW5_9ZZZZ